MNGLLKMSHFLSVQYFMNALSIHERLWKNFKLLSIYFKPRTPIRERLWFGMIWSTKINFRVIKKRALAEICWKIRILMKNLLCALRAPHYEAEISAGNVNWKIFASWQLTNARLDLELGLESRSWQMSLKLKMSFSLKMHFVDDDWNWRLDQI